LGTLPELDRIVQRMNIVGGLFLDKIGFVCRKVWVVGHCCTSEGRIADESRVDAIRNWGSMETFRSPCFLRNGGSDGFLLGISHTGRIISKVD